MLVQLIIDLVTGTVNVLLGLLPAWTPVDLSGMALALDSGPAGSVFGGLAWANWYLPINEMLSILVLRLSMEASMYVVRLIIWVLQLFHVAGGAST